MKKTANKQDDLADINAKIMKFISKSNVAPPKPENSYEVIASSQDIDPQMNPDAVYVQGLLWALAQIIIGISIIVTFAIPAVNTTMDFCNSIGIEAPELLVSFLVFPIINNGYLYVATCRQAMELKKREISISFTNLFQLVMLHNTFCLSLFSLMIFVHNLSWNWLSETSITLLIMIVVCFIASFISILRSVKGFFIMLFYPFSILLIFLCTFYNIE